MDKQKPFYQSQDSLQIKMTIKQREIEFDSSLQEVKEQIDQTNKKQELFDTLGRQEQKNNCAKLTIEK